MAFSSYRGTKILLIGFLMGGVALLGANTVHVSSPVQPFPSTFNSIAYPTDSVGLLNQCGEVYQFDIEDRFIGVIPEGYDDPRGIPTPPMLVPAYGFMSPNVFDFSKGKEATYGEKEVYSHPEIIRGLWEGVKIIWVNDNIPEEAYDFIKDYADTQDREKRTRTLVLTWDQEKDIPLDRDVAFSSWGNTQSCMTFEKQVWENFLEYTDDAQFDRDMTDPPMATVTQSGKLATWFPDK